MSNDNDEDRKSKNVLILGDSAVIGITDTLMAEIWKEIEKIISGKLKKDIGNSLTGVCKPSKEQIKNEWIGSLRTYDSWDDIPVNSLYLGDRATVNSKENITKTIYDRAVEIDNTIVMLHQIDDVIEKHQQEIDALKADTREMIANLTLLVE